MYTWDFHAVWTYRQAFWEAFLVTLRLNLLVLVIGSVLGLVIALLRASPFRAINAVALVYIDIFRTLPILVLLVWGFFCAPILLGGSMHPSPMVTAVIVLAVNLSAFVAEIVRAGVHAVPANYVASARACGLTHAQTLRYVVLPIALRNMVPPLAGQYINTVKLSVLASVIAVPELLQTSTDIAAHVNRPLESYTVLAILYLLLLLPGTIWSRRLENRRAQQAV
jgi:polar amino acid transport system permease protein